MKQCDRVLSPFTIASSSSSAAPASASLAFAASESDPEDSFWRDFNFDFSFLTSDDQKNSIDDDDSLPNSSRLTNSTTLPKAAEESELYGLNRNVLGRKTWLVNGENSDKLPNTLDSDLQCVDNKAERLVEEAACSGNIVVSGFIDDSYTNPMPALRIKRCSSGSGIDKLKGYIIPSDQDDVEVDSPCWKGIQSCDIAASGSKSWNFRRSRDDLNGVRRLNPLAPQFIPSTAKSNGKVCEEVSFSPLRRSLSSTFPLSLGEFSVTDSFEAGIDQDSGQDNSLGILFHDTDDESLGLVCQDSVSKNTSVFDISSQCQKPKKLDPLAPVFVPANAKVSAVIHGKQAIAIETNTHSVFSSTENVLLHSVQTERHSSEVDNSFRNRYSNSGHELGTTYAFEPRLGSQVRNSENTKLDSSSNKVHGKKKLNPLAPQFSLADTKQKVHASLVQSSSMHVDPYFSEVGKTQMRLLSTDTSYRNSSLLSQSTKETPPLHILGTAESLGQRYGCSTSSPSPEMDVKKLLTTIHGLSELLIHAHCSESSDSPNEQDLDLINCTVQNLNSYMSNKAEEHTGSYASDVHYSYDSKLLPNMHKESLRDKLPEVQNATYSMASGEILPVSHFGYGVNKIIGNRPTEEQTNPQVLFYKSLWLKAKADQYLMEYETFLSKTKNVSN